MRHRSTVQGRRQRRGGQFEIEDDSSRIVGPAYFLPDSVAFQCVRSSLIEHELQRATIKYSRQQQPNFKCRVEK